MIESQNERKLKMTILEWLRRKFYIKKRTAECKDCIRGNCLFNKNKHVQIVEKEVKVLDPEISRSIRLIDAVYNDEKSLDELKELSLACPERTDEDKWIVYQKQCYYGGCLYDPKEFDDEYSAYKHGTIYELLKKIIRREHKMSGATTVIADVNRSCPEYSNCSGMDY